MLGRSGILGETLEAIHFDGDEDEKSMKQEQKCSRRPETTQKDRQKANVSTRRPVWR